MVRTKADAATRVAAGGKAPKKSLKTTHSVSPGPEKVGKDNLPVNRYCPRETPVWQKKITFFYDKNAENYESNKSPEKANEKSKRNSSELDETDDIPKGDESSPEKIQKSNNMKTKSKHAKVLNSSGEENECKAMDTDE